jgi:chromosome segregation ATPase
MWSVLGLLEQNESQLMSQLATLEHDLEQAKKKTEELLQEPALIRRRIESSLRAKGKLPDDLPIRTDDLFADSVEKRINAANEDTEKRLAELETKQEGAGQAVADLRAQLKLVKEKRDRVQDEYDFADAARRKDEDAFRTIGSRLLNLKQLVSDTVVAGGAHHTLLEC